MAQEDALTQFLNNNNLNNAQSFVAGGVLGGIIAAFAVIGLVLGILLLIAGWRVFEKAGEKGWKILIPVYNVYIFFKILGMQKWFWPYLIVCVVSSILLMNVKSETLCTTAGKCETYYYGFDRPDSIIGFILMFASSIAVAVKVAINGAKAFKKSTAFAVCLFIFPNICWLILGFGSAKYNKKAFAPVAEKEEKEDKEDREDKD